MLADKQICVDNNQEQPVGRAVFKILPIKHISFAVSQRELQQNLDIRAERDWYKVCVTLEKASADLKGDTDLQLRCWPIF